MGNMPKIAISSWSLHGLLGQVWYEPDADGKMVNKSAPQSDALSLVDLPAYVANDGIYLLEICHFHFPSIEEGYLNQLRAALDKAGVELMYILIDTGNLSNPDTEQRATDIDLNKRWQEVAAKLGAKGVRIDCGLEPPTPEAIQHSAEALRELADYGAELGLVTVTENWRKTSLQANHLLDIMRQAERDLHLCVDFGNAAQTDDKSGTLAKLLPHGTSIHCKAEYINGSIDTDDLQHCLSLAKDAGFDGHITLIYGDTRDERSHLLDLKAEIEGFFAQVAG
jgi:sugar phosphate isomerase/epimerase